MIIYGESLRTFCVKITMTGDLIRVTSQGRHGVSGHPQLVCFFEDLFSLITTKTSKQLITGRSGRESIGNRRFLPR